MSVDLLCLCFISASVVSDCTETFMRYLNPHTYRFIVLPSLVTGAVVDVSMKMWQKHDIHTENLQCNSTG